MRYRHTNQRGTTIIESLIAIFIVSLFIIIAGAVYMVTTTNQFLRHKSMATSLITEQIELLYDQPFEAFANRTDASFLGVKSNRGTWSVVTSSGTPSGTQALRGQSADRFLPGLSAVAVVPGIQYGDATVEATIKVATGMPSGWQAGLLLRYQDEQNYYYTYFTNTTLVVVKTLNGTSTTLGSTVKTFTPGTWYPLRVEMTGNALTVYVNSALELSVTDGASSFADGSVALAGSNTVTADFDDVAVTEGSAYQWNFDTDTAGAMPAEWHRLSVYDLPAGDHALTIADAETGHTDLKDITATVTWTDRGTSHSLSGKTLISQ